MDAAGAESKLQLLQHTTYNNKEKKKKKGMMKKINNII